MNIEQYLIESRRGRIKLGTLAKTPVLHSMNGQTPEINEILIDILIKSTIRINIK